MHTVKWLINSYIYLNAILTRLKVRESLSLYVHIYIFFLYLLLKIFWRGDIFAPCIIQYE